MLERDKQVKITHILALLLLTYIALTPPLNSYTSRETVLNEDSYTSYLQELILEYTPSNSMIIVLPGEINTTSIQFNSEVKQVFMPFNSVLVDGGWKLKLFIIAFNNKTLLVLYKPSIVNYNLTWYEGWAYFSTVAKLENNNLEVQSKVYKALEDKGWILEFKEEILENTLYRVVMESSRGVVEGKVRISFLTFKDRVLIYTVYSPPKTFRSEKLKSMFQEFTSEYYNILSTLGYTVSEKGFHLVLNRYKSVNDRYELEGINWDLEVYEVIQNLKNLRVLKGISYASLLEASIRSKPGTILLYDSKSEKWVEAQFTAERQLLKLEETLDTLRSPKAEVVEVVPAPTPTPTTLTVSTPTITIAATTTTPPTTTPYEATIGTKQPVKQEVSIREAKYTIQEYTNIVVIILSGFIVGVLTYMLIQRMGR